MDKKALFIVTSNDKLGDSGKKTGWHLAEVSHVYYPLKEAGFEVTFASPKGGQAPVDPESKEKADDIDKKFLKEFDIDSGLATWDLASINPDDYQILYFAGGHGVMWDLVDDKQVQDIVRDMFEDGRVVGAICHGPAALVNVKLSSGDYLVKGKDINSFTDDEERDVEKDDIVPFLLESKLRQHGAHFQSAEKWGNKVVIDENLVTGQNPQSADSLAETLIATYEKQFTEFQRIDSPAPLMYPDAHP